MKVERHRWAPFTDDDLRALAGALYAAAGEGAWRAERGNEHRLSTELAAELKARDLAVELPWDHGSMNPDQWLKVVRGSGW